MCTMLYMKNYDICTRIAIYVSYCILQIGFTAVSGSPFYVCEVKTLYGIHGAVKSVKLTDAWATLYAYEDEE